MGFVPAAMVVLGAVMAGACGAAEAPPSASKDASALEHRHVTIATVCLLEGEPHQNAAPVPDYSKRTARVAVIHLNSGDIWRDGRRPERLFELLDQAAKIRPDIVLASEQQAHLDAPVTQESMTCVAEKAAAMDAYVCIGGDLFAPFFDRTLALRGAELSLDPSLRWGPDGRTNETLLRAHATDNEVVRQYRAGN